MSEATERLVALLRGFDDGLRSVWLFDQWAHERLYLREPGAEDVDVGEVLDNERYGFVTRDIYASLFAADYSHTVRGFGSFELFRTFIHDGERRVGLLAAYDGTGAARDYAALATRLRDVAGQYPSQEFLPADSDGPDRD